MAYYRPAVIEDCLDLAPRMRKQDMDEVRASHGHSPVEALLSSLNCSEEAFSIIHNDQVIGMFGVAPIVNRLGTPWLLASDELPLVSREFLPESRKWIESLTPRYDVLINYVHSKNTVSKRWLKWLGFNLLNERTFGVNTEKFNPFVMVNHV